MKNILHVVNISFVLRHFIGDQFSYFPNRGYKLFVVCSPSEDLAQLAEQNHFEYLETPINRKITVSQDIKSIVNVCKYIYTNHIDIVEGHSPKGALIAMIAAVICRVPTRLYFRHGLVYETSHGIKREILKMVDRITSFCATKVVCVSPSLMKKSIEDHLCPASKQIILGSGTCGGIDTQHKYNPDNISTEKLQNYRIKYGIKQDEFIIGYTGRLVRDKGIIELVEALDLLPKNLQAKLLLVGMFEERDALPSSVQKRIIEDPRIIYTGLINKDMEYFYRMMTVYVLPSYREGFPIGVLEAQAMQVPVLTTTATGCCDSIINEQTGLFITHDPKNIATQLTKIQTCHSYGYAGRKWVVENFDNLIIWKYIENLYQ